MEKWKEIFDGYLVSSLGNIDSLKGKKRRRLKPYVANNGYLRIGLKINGAKKNFLIHRLVAQAFIPNPESKPQINHINGIKTDNRVENLEWSTPCENALHALHFGLSPSGEARVQAKLTNEQVVYIRDNPNNLNQTQLAAMFNVTQATISLIQLGKNFKTLGGKIHTKKRGGVPIVPEGVRDKIRSEYIKGSNEFGSTALAKKYGVDHKTVLKIVHEK